MHILKKISYSILIIFIFSVAFTTFLLNTTPGLYLILKIADLNVPGEFELQKVEGNFFHQGRFKDFIYRNDDVQLQLKNAEISWKLSALLHKQLVIRKIHAQALIVDIKTNTHSDPFTLPKLPLVIHINDAHIQQLTVNKSKELLQLNNVDFAVSLSNKSWSINQLNFDYSNLHISAKNALRPTFPYTTLGAIHFSTTDPHVMGQIQLRGNAKKYVWEGNFSGALKGSIQGQLIDSQLDTTLHWDNIAYLNNNMAVPALLRTANHQGFLSLKGKLDHFLITGKGESLLPLKVNWKIAGTYKDDVLHLETAFIPVNAQHPLLGKIELSSKNFQGHFSLAKNELHVINHLTTPLWKFDASFAQPGALYPELEGLKTQIQVTAELSSLKHATAKISIAPGTYQAPEKENLPPLNFKGGQLNAVLNEKGLTAEGVLRIDAEKNLDFKTSLPKFSLENPTNPQQKIKGKANLVINSLSFLTVDKGFIENLNGKVTMALAIKGTVHEPILEGAATLSQGSLSIPKLNLNISPIEVKLSSLNQQWELNGNLYCEGKTLKLSGKGNVTPTPTGEIKITGDSFPAIRTAEYTFYISPNLSFLFDKENLTLSGDILVPTGRLKPITFSNTINLSDDVTFVSEQKTSLPFGLNVRLIMGSDVAIEVKGLHGYLDGSVDFHQDPKKDLMANGELTIRDGKYQAYGQNLKIESGHLNFNGGAFDNTTIRLQAFRTLNTAANNFSGSNQLFDFNVQNLQNLNYAAVTKVGIEVSGRIASPKIKLFSIPPSLSQADILSLLILGVPANQASKSGGQLLLTAISAMNLDSGTKGVQLLEQMKQSLGFDFTVQNTTEMNQKTKQLQEGTAFVVSKTLSKRLFLSYNIGLNQGDNNLLILKYLLNKFLSIQVSTSDSGSGIDLLYTHQKE